MPLFLSLGSWSLGLTSNCFKVLFPLKCVWIPYLLQIFLKHSPSPWVYGMTMWPMLGLSQEALSSELPFVFLMPCTGLPSWLLLMLLSSSQLLFTYLLWTFCMAHLWYLHLTKASLRCCNSSLKSSGLVKTILALCVRVPITLYLAERLWWLPHCKYWSVWVGLVVNNDG